MRTLNHFSATIIPLGFLESEHVLRIGGGQTRFDEIDGKIIL
jgi:hypothetical protein